MFTMLEVFAGLYGRDDFGQGEYSLFEKLSGLLPKTGGDWALLITSLLAITASIIVFIRMRKKAAAQDTPAS